MSTTCPHPAPIIELSQILNRNVGGRKREGEMEMEMEMEMWRRQVKNSASAFSDVKALLP